MGLQTPTPRLLVCAECVRRASTSFTGNGGSWASSFTQILQEQMDERAWQKRTLCTAAATTAAPHKRVPCIVQAHEHQVGVERGRGGHMHTTQQLHRCLAFLMKKEGDEEEEKQEMGWGGELRWRVTLPQESGMLILFSSACQYPWQQLPWQGVHMVQLCQLVGTMFELVHWDPEQTGGGGRRERGKKKLPHLNPFGNADNPLDQLWKDRTGGRGVIVKVEVVLVVVWGFCLAAQEEPGFLDWSKQTHYTGTGS